MGSKWKRVLITDVCDLIVDCINKTAPTVQNKTKYKMIRTPNVKRGRVNTDNCRYVNEDTFIKWTRRARVKRDDVLLTREAPLGEVGIVNTDENIFLGQRIMQYRANPNLINPYFLLYSFLSQDLQHQFNMHEGSGSVVSHIRVGDCSKFKLNLPSIEIQKKIVSVLQGIDHKIDLNQQVNETLETMAQALFKSWFVDFDPVIDNALTAGNPIPDALNHRVEQRKSLQANETEKQKAIRVLFPDSFEYTEAMGWIPKGWEANDVASSIYINPKYSLKKGVTAQYADMKSLPESGYNIKGVIEKKYSGGVKFQNRDILFARITPCLENGKTGIVDFLKPEEVGFGSTEFIVMREKGSIKMEFIACLARNDKFRLHAQQSMVGSSGRQRVQNTCFSSFYLALPSDNEKILKSFNEMTEVNFTKVTKLSAENNSLSKLRDTLLPKLLSGELRLPDAEKLVEEV